MKTGIITAALCVLAGIAVLVGCAEEQAPISGAGLVTAETPVNEPGGSAEVEPVEEAGAAEGEVGEEVEADSAESQPSSNAPAEPQRRPQRERSASSAPSSAGQSQQPTASAEAPASPRRPVPGADGDGPRRGDDERRRSLFERFDANEDGKLSAAELPEQMRERIMRADADGDGFVTAEEQQAAREAFRRERQARARRGPDAAGGERRGDGLIRMFERADEIYDGALSAAEIPEEFRARLMESDANGDGKLTREELEAVRAQIEAHVRAQGGRPGGPPPRRTGN